jgi:hypothetical protein
MRCRLLWHLPIFFCDSTPIRWARTRQLFPGYCLEEITLA